MHDVQAKESLAAWPAGLIAPIVVLAYLGGSTEDFVEGCLRLGLGGHICSLVVSLRC
jgi:hypothetical protein